MYEMKDVTCAVTGSIMTVKKSVPFVVPKGKFMKKSQNPKNQKFPHIAKVIKESRRALGVISQDKLSLAIGYKNGQFISNIERGLCSLPDDKIKVVAECLQIEPQILIEAILADHREQLVGSL